MGRGARKAPESGGKGEREMEIPPVQRSPGVRRVTPPSCKIGSTIWKTRGGPCPGSGQRGTGSECQSRPWKSEQRRQEMVTEGKSVCLQSTQSSLESLPHRKLMRQEGPLP